MPRTGRYDTPREGAPHILRIELSEDLHWPYETDGETEIEDAGWTVGTAKFVKFVGGITDPVLNPSPTALGRVPVAIPDVTFEVFDIQKRQGLSGERFYAIYQWDSERFEIIASPTNVAYSVSGSGSQLINSAGVTVTLDTQIHRVPDNTDWFSLAASRITIKKAGIYPVSWTVSFQHGANAATDRNSIYLTLNASLLKGSVLDSPSPADSIQAYDHFSGSLDLKAAAGDILDMRATADGSFTILNMTSDDQGAMLNIHRVP